MRLRVNVKGYGSYLLHYTNNEVIDIHKIEHITNEGEVIREMMKPSDKLYCLLLRAVVEQGKEYDNLF